MQDMGFVLYDSLVKKSNVTIIPPKDTAWTKAYNLATFSKDLDDHEYRVLSQISACTLHGFKAEKMSFLSGSGRPALENALNRLIARGIVLRQTYYAYDSGIEGVGRPRTVYHYCVDNSEVERLAAIKKEESDNVLLVPIELAHITKAAEKRRVTYKNGVSVENQPSQSTDALHPVNAQGQPLILSNTKSISKELGKIHDCHLAGKASVLNNSTYTDADKAKLPMFIEKLARNGNVLPTLELFHDRFNAYLEVCEENADKWAETNGVLKVPSRNEKSINGLLRGLREPFKTVVFAEYEKRFFDLMNEQHRIVDTKSVIYANQLRDLYNKGELENYFNSLPKKSPSSKK